MDKVEYPEDSDTSDEDFDPGKTANEAVSEVESDGDSEDPLSDKEDLGTRTSKRKKRNTKSRKKQKINEDTSDDLNESPEKKKITEEEQKKKVDDLWAMFKKDTGFKSKTQQKINTEDSKENKKEQNLQSKVETEPKKETVKVTQIFEFAGEEVRVEKEVSTKEAKLINKPSCSVGSSKRGGAKSGGLSSLLGQLGKKQKITTLEKSKLDWDKFKKEENLEEELQTFNKGKDGYLEKQDFLQRTDVRRFEIERDIRNIERNKRMNMNNVD